MTRSMTAYGRASLSSNSGVWQIELQSVNKKHLDIHLEIPRQFLFLQFHIRKKLEKLLSRGQIFLKLTHMTQTETTTLSASTLQALHSLLKRWQNAAQSLGLDKKEITLDFLVNRLSESMAFEDQQEHVLIEDIIDPLFEKAYADFLSMKINEGVLLVEDVMQRIRLLRNILTNLKTCCDTLPERYKKKLLERLELLNPLNEELLDRAAKEVLFYAEKMDITEERVRLNSHLGQMQELLTTGSKTSIGRTLEFLLQEAFREVNTMGSKVLDLEAVRLTLEMKGELEKIREQIQNIE